MSDYFQIEGTWSSTEDDIVLIINVPCLKTTSLLTIYKYLPFPIPFKTKAHDLTIKQSLNFQDSYLSKSIDENLFEKDNMDYEQIQQAVCNTDTADLITIDNKQNFQIFIHTNLANCKQFYHVYLCDTKHVVQLDLTDTFVGSLYLRIENGVSKNFKFNKDRFKKWYFN